MQTIIDLLNVLGYVSTLIVLAGACFAVISYVRGILPVWWRLGQGLSNRRIAVFAEEEFKDLHDLLVDSRLFQKSNIIQIGKTSLKKAEVCTVFLMHWGSFAGEIDEILRMKSDTTALIVYARPGEIDNATMAKINQHRNTIVVNFRGRLMNDILVSMITTGYKLK